MSSRLRVVLLVGVLVVVVAVGGAIAVGAAADDGDEGDDPDHEHPDEVADEDDLEGLQGWLGDRMGEIHVDCTEGIAIGDFDACEDLDEEYESLLERYVTAERETTDEEDRESDTFEETREDQQELAELMEEFNATYDDYRDARDRGDEREARRLARELLDLAERIEALGGEVAVNFRRLDGSVSSDLNESADRTQEATDEIVLIALQIEEESFEPTTIDVTADERASFNDPGTVSGAVQTENGSAIPGARVVLADDEQQFTTRTDDDGGYSLAYRPTRTEVGTTNLTVTFVPDDDDPYLGANATTTVTVEPTSVNVSIEAASAEAAFGENVTVEGEVGATGDPVPGVTATVTIGGEPIATARTDQDGQFQAIGALPVDVPAGVGTLSVRVSREDRAITPATESTTIEVLETETELTVTSSPTGDTAEVSGRLSADAPDDVGERPLTVSVDGEDRSVRTDDDGRFSLAVDRREEPQEVVVAYDEPGSNLAPSRATTTIDRQEEPASSVGTARSILDTLVGLMRDSPIVAGLLVVGVLAAVVAGGYVWRERRHSGPQPAAPGGGTGVATADGADPARPEGPSPEVTLIEAARARLESSPEAAIQIGYGAVRTGLGGDADQRTHWEFYDDASGALEDSRLDALRSLTEAFEQATFSPTSVDLDRARSALKEAERCLGVDSAGTDGAVSADGGTAASANAGGPVGEERTD